MPAFEAVEFITWLFIATILYHYFVYPILLRRLATFLTRSAAGQALVGSKSHSSALPKFTIIVPAYNESAFIARKIANFFTFDYPPELLKIVIAQDGCTDDTKRLAISAIERVPPRFSIELVEYPRNVGKIVVLN